MENVYNSVSGRKFQLATGIEEVANSQQSKANSQLYDLLGNKVSTPQAGRIYIQNGKKKVVK